MALQTRFTALIRIAGSTYKFTDRVTTDRFTAELITDSERVTLRVEPTSPMSFEELAVICRESIGDDDRLFLNGYQSWTDSREWSAKETQRGIDRIPSPLVKKYNFDKYGDYNFTHYHTTPGVLHGFTYGYIRTGSEYRLYGSLSERCGFTKVTVHSSKQRVKLSRECEGAVYAEPFNAVDAAVLTGTEREAFDRWFLLMGIAPASAKPLTGYTSWYRHYQDISEEKLLHDLDAIVASGRKLDIFQIDDGYQTGVGDWLSIDESKFPNGLRPVCDRIHSEGMLAGLWLAPFVCEENSRLYREHADWLMRDENGAPLPAGCNWSGSYALDIYNEEVREYLREVFTCYLNECGFDLVKLDFLYAACIIPANGKSRGEIMADGMDFLRECVGDRLILGCGVPLGSAFGKVEYCRIGCDVGLSWNDNLVMQMTHRERVSTKNSMLNTVFRRQLNGRAFLNDPDVFLLRDESISLKQCQKMSLAVINHLFGSVFFTSDDVGTYNESQLRLERIAKRMVGAEIHSADLTDGILTVSLTENGRDRTLRLDTSDGRLI